jgi:peptidoglycan hydrolase CwlO-like protein
MSEEELESLENRVEWSEKEIESLERRVGCIAEKVYNLSDRIRLLEKSVNERTRSYDEQLKQLWEVTEANTKFRDLFSIIAPFCIAYYCIRFILS